MRTIEELCCYYVALLRSAYLIHQNSHWLSRGKSFYGQHLLFERLYTNSGKDADMAAEKMIGVFGDDTMNLNMQAQLIGKMMLKHCSPTPIENSLKIEEEILSFSQKFYDTLKEEGKLTLGVDDMVMAIASNREENVYLLQQVEKESETKTAGRKAVLRKQLLSKLAPTIS